MVAVIANNIHASLVACLPKHAENKDRAIASERDRMVLFCFFSFQNSPFIITIVPIHCSIVITIEVFVSFLCDDDVNTNFFRHAGLQLVA